jgi:RNA-splicing ligase RtcB
MIFKANPKTPLSINYCLHRGSRQAGRQVCGMDINIQEMREREVAAEEEAGDKGEKDSIRLFSLQCAAIPSNWVRQYRSFSVSQCSCF